MANTQQQDDLNFDYKYGFSMKDSYTFKARKGLDAELVKEISLMKGEPGWMTDYRLKAYEIFLQKPMPKFGPDLSKIDFDNIYYYIKPTDGQVNKWEDLPKEIKDTYDRIGVPEAEKKFLAGVSAQYDSEVVYESINKELDKKGILFCDMDTALKKYPDIVKQYFGTLIPSADNKFAALNSAVWSGGSFVYVPKGVKVGLPLQAYFRINAERFGQFERTMIIAEDGADVHYVEGCFLAGAKVRTSEGEKNIENISVGDKVITHNGRLKRVYKTMDRAYKGDIYTITYFGDSGSVLKVTSEHPLLICKRQKKEYRNTSFKPQWLEAKDAKVGDYLAYPISQKETEKEFHEREIIKLASPNMVEEKRLIYNYQPSVHMSIPFGYGRVMGTKELDLTLDPDFYRLLGYFYSEGHVENEHYISFTFHVSEIEYLEDVKNLVQRYFGKDMHIGKERNHGIILTLSSTIAARLFAREFGSTNRTKNIPTWVTESPKEHLRELLRGMWRGDGSFDERRKLFRYSSVSKSLIHGFRDALLKLGILASINSQVRKAPKQVMHSVIISRVANQEFGKIVGIDAPNGRKEGSPFFIDGDFLYMPIKSIEVEATTAQVYNFSVEDDESYIAEGVISHNCTAPTYTTESLHSAVVEIFCKENSRVRYTTVQNWSTNVYNLVTKRARADKNAFMEWIDCNLGSAVTMKYPSVYLMGEGARGEVLSIAFANKGQIQDAGAKMIHLAPNTKSRIVSKSISKGGGQTSYRGLVNVSPHAHNSSVYVSCDALILDELSRSDTYPFMKIKNNDVEIQHEATVEKLGEEKLFYLMSRGIKKIEAEGLLVNGFIEPVSREIPLEYSVELNRLINLEMEGSVG